MTYGNNYPPQGAPAAQGPRDGGYLYPNDKKQTAQQPDQKGKISISPEIAALIMSGTREFYLSAWNKQDAKGQRFLSVKMKQIQAQPQGGYGGAGQTQYAPQPQQQWPQNPPPPQHPQYPPQGGHAPQTGPAVQPQYHGGGGGHAVPGVALNGPQVAGQWPQQGGPKGYAPPGNPMDQEIPF